MVKVIWQKGLNTAAHEQFSLFARWRQCASHLIRASLDPPKSTTQTASRSVQPFLHSSRQTVLIFYNGLLLPPSKLSFCMGIWS